MILLLFTSFCLIYLGASFSLKLLRVYPDVACTNLPEYGDEDAMQRAAIREWRLNNALKKKDIEVSYTGYVQCFCNDRAAAHDPSD